MASFECVPSHDKKENDHKVFSRDRFKSCRVFHVDDSENNEDEKSKEVLECVSRSSVSETGESLQIPFSNPNPNPTSSPLEIKGASSLVQMWEAWLQQSSSSPKQYLINTEFLNDEARKNDENSGDEIDSEEFSKMVLRDRENELKQLVDRNAVSKFSPRGSGHLKYMLTNRSFERCIAIQETNCDVNRSSQGSSVMNIRDKYKTNTEKGSTGNVNSTVATQNSSFQVNKECKVANKTEDKNVLQEITERSIPRKTQDVTYKPEIAKKLVLTEDAGNKNSFKNPRIEGNSTEEREEIRKAMVKESKETNKSSMSFAERVNLWEERRMKEEDSSFEECKSMEIDEYRINPEEVTLPICLGRRKEEEETVSHNSRKNVKEINHSQEDDETLKAKNEEASGMNREARVLLNSWDEIAMGYEEKEYFCGESVKNDWMSNLLKPKSHWEALREQWGFEVMNQSSEKDDIRNLLKRRLVSSCLASEFREKIEGILISRARKRSKLESTLVEEKEEAKEKEEEKKKEKEEEEEEEEDEGEVTEESLVACSARYQKKLEEDETVKVDLQNPTNHENSSSMICDLREEIKQLQREMLELKSLVKSCVDFKKSESLSDSLERNCSVCFQMPVVSLLYRCGHMCTSLKCASME